MGLIKKAIIAGAVISILKNKKEDQIPPVTEKVEETKTEIQVTQPDQIEMSNAGSTIDDLIFGGLLVALISLFVILLIKFRRK